MAKPNLASPEKEFAVQSSWCVYWDKQSAEYAKSAEPFSDDLVLFACLYDENGELYIPEQLRHLKNDVAWDGGGNLYISFVNDVMHKDGHADQKDPELLAKLFSNERTMRRCAQDMINRAVIWDCDGIEIDFEGMEKREELWEPYIKFISIASDLARKSGMEIRVVLGAYAPTDRYVFPVGPEYVVMCYNLYGMHSGAGPKADTGFLQETALRFESLDKVTFALANGGFEWNSANEAVDSLTVPEAERLLLSSGAQAARDTDSQALTFSFQADDGMHTVWYGDQTTVQAWKDILENTLAKEVRVDLWRLDAQIEGGH